MEIVRLYDRAREPQSWMQVIRPTEFAAFATLAESGVACDADGQPTSDDEAICLLFETLPRAEAFCRERVERIPRLRFDIRDAAGLLRPPLLTIVHPSRAAALDGSDAKIRRYRRAAILLLVAGPPLIWFDWRFYEGVQVVPTMLGINFILIGVRLLMLNYSHQSDERRRQERARRAASATALR